MPETLLEMMTRKIKYYEARESRQQQELRGPEFKSAEVRLTHTREMLQELRHIRSTILIHQDYTMEVD